MKVSEIFSSIDGEGIRVGSPVCFIRLAGCNLRCTYCDTLYALFGEDEPCEYRVMSIDEIIAEADLSYKRVTLTGGEPLIHEGAAELVNRLTAEGCEVNIETNGAADIREFSKSVENPDRMFYTIDYKLKSSGMSDKMLWSNFEALRQCDVIKLVVGSDEDVSLMLSVTERLTRLYGEDNMPHIFIGAVYGAFENSKLVDIILKEPLLKNARIQLQIHKYIWDPDKKGV